MMTLEQNKAALRQIIEAINRHDIDAAVGFLRSDFIYHGRQGDVDLQTWEANLKVLIAAFPDLRLMIEDTVAERDTVAARYMWEGTHRGDFHGITPTGRHVAWRVIAFYRLTGNKFVEAWTVADDVTQQLR